MKILIWNSRSKLAVTALALVMVLSSCATPPEAEERFAQATGTTWRVAGAPRVFERTEARFSRSARDYAYLGPVAINRRGTYDYFLWIGIGSTLDRGFLAPEETAPDRIMVFVDDEPLELELMDWDRRVPGLTGRVPYDPPVTVEWNLAARVTLDQIALISNRGVKRLLLHTEDGRSREFYEWGEQATWTTFVEDSPGSGRPALAGSTRPAPLSDTEPGPEGGQQIATED